MIMKLSKVIVFFMFLILQGSVLAGDNAKKEAETLLSTMGMETALEKSIETMLNIQMQQKPTLAPFKNVMLKFFKKHMSFESLKPDMIEIYADAFSASELREINAFYKTATGSKTIRLLPGLMAKGANLGSRRVQENITELQQMIKAEAERLQKAQNK